MKRIPYILSVILTFALSMETFADIAISKISMDRTGAGVVVTMTVNLEHADIKSTSSVSIIPVISDGEGNTMPVKGFTVAGRTRYYNLLRNGYDEAESGPLYRFNKKMPTVEFSKVVEYEEWMDNSSVSVQTVSQNCCATPLEETYYNLAAAEFKPTNLLMALPEFVFITPEVEEVKHRNREARAYVKFKVNETEILPDYRDNTAQLDTIRQTIDEIRNNPDVSISALSIKGYASPEGSYSNNERLAKGRTGALADYVSWLYNFPNGLVATSYEPEDWEGLRQYIVDNPQIDGSSEILAIIDSNLDPDEKDAKIRTDFPTTYNNLLIGEYPLLRHSDYRIDYVVRSYTTIEEIAEVYKTAPGNLSLNELFRLALSYPEGSREYSDVFETAVRLFPNSTTAAINAANVALQRNDTVGAETYLEKAGDSPEAEYVRGIHAAMTGDYDDAIAFFTKAQEGGIPQAANAISIIETSLKDRKHN